MSNPLPRHSKVLDEVHKIREKISRELRGKPPEEAVRYWKNAAGPSAESQKILKAAESRSKYGS